MSADLVKELREDMTGCELDWKMREEAADKIEQLERELADMMKDMTNWREFAVSQTDQLAAEKALADRLWKAWKFNGYAPDAVAAYRKAREQK